MLGTVQMEYLHGSKHALRMLTQVVRLVRACVNHANAGSVRAFLHLYLCIMVTTKQQSMVVLNPTHDELGFLLLCDKKTTRRRGAG